MEECPGQVWRIGAHNHYRSQNAAGDGCKGQNHGSLHTMLSVRQRGLDEVQGWFHRALPSSYRTNWSEEEEEKGWGHTLPSNAPGHL